MPNRNPPRHTARPRADAALPPLPKGFSYYPPRPGLIRYRYVDEGGTTVAKYGRTVEECLDQRYPRSAPMIQDPGTVATYLRTYVRELAARPNTKATASYQVEHYLIPLLGSIRLDRLTRDDVLDAMARLRVQTSRTGRTLAPRTVSLAYATLNAALNAAVSSVPSRIPANPAARINPNGVTGAGARAREVGLEFALPSDLDIARVRRELGDTVRGRAAVLSAVTGLRQSELLALTGADIHGDELRVRAALPRGSRILDDPKNRSSARWVPLGPVAREVLAHQRTINPSGLLFTEPDGSPINGSNLSKWYADQLVRLGIPHHRWHDLRHYYASTLLNRYPIQTVAKLLGHADVTVTSRVYHHLLRSDAADTAVVAERAFAV